MKKSTLSRLIGLVIALVICCIIVVRNDIQSAMAAPAESLGVFKLPSLSGWQANKIVAPARTEQMMLHGKSTKIQLPTTKIVTYDRKIGGNSLTISCGAVISDKPITQNEMDKGVAFAKVAINTIGPGPERTGPILISIQRINIQGHQAYIKRFKHVPKSDGRVTLSESEELSFYSGTGAYFVSGSIDGYPISKSAHSAFKRAWEITIRTFK